MTREAEARRPVRVLFLCTGNSARSQMAEALTRSLGKGRVQAFSAGTNPRPIHPEAVRSMAAISIDISRQESKPLERYEDELFDFVITVCDRLKPEDCPIWPKAREQIRWSIEDPATGDPAEVERRFKDVVAALRQRVSLFLLSNHVMD